MRHRFVWLVGAALAGLAGCGDGGGGPSPGGGGDDDGARTAARFEELADSVDGVGLSPTAEALRHAAEIVRLTGHSTPVTLTIDGTSRSFLAVAEQLDFPQLQCWWPADSTGLPPRDTVFVDPDSAGANPPTRGPVTECTEVGTYTMRTLIAWEPERMAEVVRLVADVGSNQVDNRVPDVMAGASASSARDSTPGSGPPPPPGPPPGPDPLPGDTVGGGGGNGGPGFPGFIGEYLVADEGAWFAVEGSQTNELVGSGGACTSDGPSFDWAEFRCEAARFGYEFSMRVEPLPIFGGPIPPPGGEVPLEGNAPGTGPGGEHAIAMTRSEVDGVRLAVVRWAPPPLPEPLPPPGPVPPDSVVTNH